jgi:hypothetical protein
VNLLPGLAGPRSWVQVDPGGNVTEGFQVDGSAYRWLVLDSLLGEDGCNHEPCPPVNCPRASTCVPTVAVLPRVHPHEWVVCCKDVVTGRLSQFQPNHCGWALVKLWHRVCGCTQQAPSRLHPRRCRFGQRVKGSCQLSMCQPEIGLLGPQYATVGCVSCRRRSQTRRLLMVGLSLRCAGEAANASQCHCQHAIHFLETGAFMLCPQPES